MKHKHLELVVFFLFTAMLVLAGERNGEKRILFLNSARSHIVPYYEIFTECNRVLSSSRIAFQPHYEDLELLFPKSNTQEETKLRVEHILERLKNREFDIVVPVGQGAVDIILDYSDYLPDEMAVIPLGIGIDVSKLTKKHRNMTAIIGESGEEKCMDLIFRMLPDTECLFYICSGTEEGEQQRERLRKRESRYPKLKCVYPDNYVSTLNEVADQIAIRGRRTVVILDSWFSNDANFMELENFTGTLRKLSIRTFCTTDGLYSAYALGGAYPSASDMGVALGNVIREAVRRGNVCSGENKIISARQVLNFPALERARISTANLPTGIRVIGRNEVFIKKQAEWIVVSIWGSVILSILLVLCLIVILHGRRSTRKSLALLRNMPGRILLSDIGGKVYMLH